MWFDWIFEYAGWNLIINTFEIRLKIENLFEDCIPNSIDYNIRKKLS